MVLLCLFVVLISVSSVSAASTVYVNATGGNDSYNGTIDHPYQTIGQGINSVTENGTVYIADGTYSGTGNTNLTITKNMNITGQSQQGTIINGQQSGNSIFTINKGVTVTITNLTLTNGTDTNYGGAIYNYGNLTITNSTLTDNTAAVGGAIYNYGNLTITNSTLKDNTATNTGGAIINDHGTLTVTNSTLTDNTAQQQGGAIYNYQGTLTVTNSTLTDNTAAVGGAIFNEGNLTVINSTLTDNTAAVGGAIFNEGNLTVINSTLTGNTAAVGGAIYNYAGTVTITNSTLKDNTATYGDGGAIYNHGDNLTVTSSTLTNNTAEHGGAIYNEDGSSVVHFNRIVGNSPNTTQIYSRDGTVDATLNWWGSNVDPSVYVNSNVNVTSWLVLNITANPTSISNGANSTVTVDLLHDNTGNYYDPVNGHVPDGTPVTFNLSNTSLGSLNTISTTLKNGKATTKFTAANIGNENVTATVDNQLESTLIIINKSNNNNNTNGKNTTNTVNAATQTIAMQPTGMPIAGLVLAILAIFGGMLPRRKQ